MLHTDEILTVKTFSWDYDSFVIRCPHCKDTFGIEGEAADLIRGEQYQHRCGGWVEVDDNAVQIHEF